MQNQLALTVFCRCATVMPVMPQSCHDCGTAVSLLASYLQIITQRKLSLQI